MIVRSKNYKTVILTALICHATAFVGRPSFSHIHAASKASIPTHQWDCTSHEQHIISVSNRNTQLHHNPTGIAAAIESTPVLKQILSQPVFWTFAIMTSIVALLYSWEEGVHALRKNLPKTLTPVLDSMLAEMGGLGFIGIFLGLVVVDGPLGDVIGQLSEDFLGNEEILLETFEFLHTAIFEVAIAYFLVAGTVVARLVNQIKYLEEFSLAVLDMDGDGNVSLEELAVFLDVDAVVVDANGDGVLDEEEVANALRAVPKSPFWEEIFMTSDQIRAETLVVRERFVELGKIPPSYEIESYFVPIFGNYLKDVVKLSPLFWLPLIPGVALGRSVDLRNDVVSAASANAYLSCGGWISGGPYFFVTCVGAFGILTWGVWNFWKMNEIKQMLLPTLVNDSNASGSAATLLPPRYTDKQLLKEFSSSPGIFGLIERPFIKKPKSDHEQLFGAVGGAGPEFYLQSIKYQTWVTVALIVFWGFQIVARDYEALSKGWQVADPNLVRAELAAYGTFVSLALGQLLLAPQTFLNFCLVTSIEYYIDTCLESNDLCFDLEDMPLQEVEEEQDKSFSSGVPL